ncbi:glycosyltransferase [Empedobacter falsenii]|uniref:glycosyltransferase n=1 Tax=Empedobacter falsenii TaxID=343874 RepID=UPI0025751E80|nr:hypothetical protein [Empedobacter falsenii]MDM1547547.1 glycosyltransferase [Empedobacter falsenii]
MSVIQENNRYLKKNIKIAKLLYHQGLYEDCINQIEKTAQFAWHFYSGIYRSNKLENLLNDIGSQLVYNNSKKIIRNNLGKYKIIHICSEIYETGGHTKLMYNWINVDSEHDHSIATTRLSLDQLKNLTKFYTSSINESNLYSVKTDSKIESAKQLTNILSEGYDLIVLHTHPDDCLVNLVFSNPQLEIPVFMVNHADHVFWLGASVIDVLLQIRETNISADKLRRQLKNQFFLPIPIVLEENKTPNVLKDYKIINLLSTGSYYKYLPDGKYNFLEEMKRLVNKFQNVVVHIVGIDKDSDYALQYKHERIIYHGLINQEKLEIIEDKTDIYLEGFPTPSFMSLLKPALKKIPFQLHYNPSLVYKLFNDDSEYYIDYPNNIEEWRKAIEKLINNEEYRSIVAQKQFEYVSQSYQLSSWKEKIAELYKNSKILVHHINKENKDIYIEGENESKIALLEYDVKISHFQYTEKLNLLSKLQVYYYSKHKHNKIHYQLSSGIYYYLKNKDTRFF